MSLGDSAVLCLYAIISLFAEIDHTEEEYKEIIQHTLLEAVRKGLKSKTEVKGTVLYSGTRNRGQAPVVYFCWIRLLLSELVIIPPSSCRVLTP